jgi:DNA polymerase III subunit alpha
LTENSHPQTAYRIRDEKEQTALDEVMAASRLRVEKKLPSQFVGLHVHSEHSFLDGYSKVEHIAKRAKELGQGAVALTDHGECGGHLLFQKACTKEGVKPIFGMEGYWMWDIQKSRDEKTRGYNNSHITLLAQNQKGLSNLWAWSSKAYQKEYFYNKPLADPALMREHSEGLYASDGCLLTEFARSLKAGDTGKCREIYGLLLSVFGDRFYSELHTFQIVDPLTDEHIQLNAEMAAMNQFKVQLCREFSIPLVVVNDNHYSWPEDWENHELVWAMSTGGDMDKMERGQAAAHHMGDEEIYYWMSRHGISRSVTEEAIKNTYEIANNCNVEIKPTLEMPRLTESDEDDVKLLLKQVEAGYKRKIEGSGLNEEAYYSRMEEELKLITEKNFSGYFNIVADYTKAAKTGEYGEWIGLGKQSPMLVGPSRGSAGGSLVAYLMDITEIDPLKYGLLFGRFISPSRKGYPDIDLDFPQSRRPHMKEYLAAKYGGDHVCAIGTRSKSKPRGILADLCRAMDIPYEDKEKMSLIISEVEDIDTTNVEVSWDEVLLDKGGELTPWVKKYPRLFEKMGEMVGIVRQASVHAAGILVLGKKQPLSGNLPTRVRNGVVSTQFDMYEVEEMGAVKFDILGIRHLDTLEVARDLVKERHGVYLDYYSFGDKEFSDPEIWTLIDEGRTDGIFQLEAHQMTKCGKVFKPRHERDVADLISVNRPGVIRADLLWPYLKRRAGEEEPEYDHPMMEAIVGETHGIIVYQEQVIRTVIELGHFTLDEAEKVRKNLGKMLYSEMKKMEDLFIQGCLNNPDYMAGVTNKDEMVAVPEKDLTYYTGRKTSEDANKIVTRAEQIARKIWVSIRESGIYVFNKSHAMGYGLISSWETWLKAKYFLETEASLMMTDPPNVNRYLREARLFGVSILPPDVNESGSYFTLTKEGRVRYGLEAIKGVGASAVNDILANRPFDSFAEFLCFCSSTGAAKKGVVEKLIMIGAFDTLGKREEHLQEYFNHRVLMLLSPKRRENIILNDQVAEHLALYYADYYSKRLSEGWVDEYFIPDFSDENTIYAIEKELVGNFITQDPFLKYEKAIDNLCIKDPEEIELSTYGDILTIGGQLISVKMHKTVKGRNPGSDMAFLTIRWDERDFEVTCFPEAWTQCKQFLTQGAPVIVQAQKIERGAHLLHVERLDYIL